MGFEMNLVRLFVFVAFYAAFAVNTCAETTGDEGPTVQPSFLNEKMSPLIDGVLDDSIWEASAVISDFHQSRPLDHGPVSEKTEAQIVVSSDYLYVAFKVHDSDVKSIDAKGLVQGQTFFSDDRVSVNLDTFNDQRNSYFFQVNPNGVRRDALVGNDYFIDDWDTVWDAAAKIYEWGWAVEMAIPFKSIAFDPKNTTWGLNLTRNSPRRGEEMAWSSVDRNTSPSAFGKITGMTGFSQGKGIELNPSLSLGYKNSDSVGSDSVFEPSLTGFYNITPFLTAGLTLNTDFSGTEVDERKLNLGRFSLFFPEKRDFFLRDASIFEFGGLDGNARPFFSRRIGLSDDGDPLDLKTGLKLSGRAGDWNLGGLLIKQDTIAEGADDELFVGRATRNVFDESEIGVIATSGDPNSDSGNSLTGLDYTYRNSHVFGDQSVRANFWFQESNTNGFYDDQSAYGVRLSYPNYKYEGHIDLRRIEENFNPALGFVNRSGVEQVNGRFRRRFQLDNSYFDWLGARAQYFRSDRIDGEIQTERYQLNFLEGFSGKNDFFTVFLIDQTEGIEESFTLPGELQVMPGEYNFKRYGVFFETGPQRELSAEFLYANGDFFGGDRELVELELNWRPNKHFFAGLSFENNDIKTAEGEFTSKLYSARANIAFNSEWAWLNLVQGDNVSDTVSVNSRLRYQPSANKEFLLVFNQTVDNTADKANDYSIVFKASFNYQL